MPQKPGEQRDVRRHGYAETETFLAEVAARRGDAARAERWAGLAAGTQVAALANGKLTRDAWAKFNFPTLAVHDDFKSFAATLR